MPFLGLSSPLRLIKSEDPVRSALARGAARLLALQRNDPGWEGSWRRYVGSDCSSTHTSGLCALGLIEWHRVSQDQPSLSGARAAAAFAAAHIGVGASAQAYHPRFTGADLIMLQRLFETTGEEAYRARAIEEWRNLRSYFYFGSALELHRFFQKIERQMGAWDLAFYLEAAELCGDTAWADGAASVLAGTLGGLYGERANEYRALNVAAAVRSLAGQGYGAIHKVEMEALVRALLEAVDEGAVAQNSQDTAYAVLALLAAGAPYRGVAARLVQALVTCQEHWGGWIIEGVQYPHVVGEALWALASFVGRRGARERAVAPSPEVSSGRGARQPRFTGVHEPVAPFDGI